MDNRELTRRISNFVKVDLGNRIDETIALTEECRGMQIYETPLLGFADAEDPLFLELKRPEAAGPGILMPQEWLPGARTVITVFFPYTEQVRKSNRKDIKKPSPQWLHGRVEGQTFVMRLITQIKKWLTDEGYEAVVPSADDRFWMVERPGTNKMLDDPSVGFSCAWSERHVAYVGGLGTFGLSRGIITEKGMCGRLGSVITSAEFKTTSRDYVGVYEYCIQCGACVDRCPVNAISAETGKDHVPCSYFIDYTKEAFHPRYGCGKCQVSVPCEHRRPCRK